MRIRLNLHKPSAHWIGLANVVAQSDELREDVTLIVDAEGARFYEGQTCDIPIAISASAPAIEAIDTLDGKLAFIAWLHQRFPKPQPGTPARAQLRRALPNFHRSSSMMRAIRFGATSR
jgi:hypothetical protein